MYVPTKLLHKYVILALCIYIFFTKIILRCLKNPYYLV